MKPHTASQSDKAAQLNAVSFFIDRHAHDGSASRTAIVHDSGKITYAELARSVNQAGNYLLRLGVQPEQRILLHLHDSPEWVYFFMAAIKIGAVAVPVNTYCPPELLTFYLNDSRARVIVTHRQYTAKLPPAPTVPLLEHVVYVNDEPWKLNPSELSAFPVASDDSAFWLYTSGSTGQQKAVVHRHAGMLACARGYSRDVLNIKPGDRCYSASKLFFAYGLGNSITFPFSVGATTILRAARSDMDTVLRTIRETKPTLFFAVPTLYNHLLTEPAVDKDLFATVRMCVSAGEYLPETLFDRWRARTGQVLYDGIGSTEAMHIFCSNRPSGYKPGTSGLPVDGYDLKIVDTEGAELAPMSVGRLLVRGKTLAKGYWNRYEANQSAFLGEWLATGDIYEKTADGYFKYIGRQDDVFKSSGMWVSPGEIELALMSHGLVSEAAVVALRGPTGTTSAKAFVVLADGAGKGGEERFRQEIYAHLEGRLSKYKIPSQIEFLSALPKTATGKVSRAELRKLQAAAYVPSVASASLRA